MINGVSMDAIYMYTLIICALLAFLLVIFGDVFDFDGPVDPMLIIPWLAFTSLFGYIGERIFKGDHVVIALTSGALSVGLVFLLNFYVLLPMKDSEATISLSERDMEGVVATVVTPIPSKGMGEIQLKSVTGSINRPAAFYTPQEVACKSGEEVLIIEIRDRVCYVVPYEESLKV